jgi:hypothetical protein
MDRKEYNHKRYLKNKKRYLEYRRQYHLNHLEKDRAYYLDYLPKWRERKRIEAFEIIAGKGNVKCRQCGFSDIRALQINHINYDGAAERRKTGILGGYALSNMIVRGKRKKDDLEILCANCHSIVTMETKKMLRKGNRK